MYPDLCVHLEGPQGMSLGYKHRHQFPYEAIYSAGKTGTLSNEVYHQISNKRQSFYNAPKQFMVMYRKRIYTIASLTKIKSN